MSIHSNQIPDNWSINDDDTPLTPRQRDIDMLDDHDPITISVYPPSTGNMSPRDGDRSSYLAPNMSRSVISLVPEGGLHQNHGPDLTFSTPSHVAEQDIGSGYQISVDPAPGDDPSSGSGKKTDSSRSLVHEDFRSVHSTNRAEARSWAPQIPRWPEPQVPPVRETFTAIDPFAHKKHRLSWSSILSVKDGKKRQEKPPSAWTAPVLYPTGEELAFEEEADSGLEDDGVPIKHIDYGWPLDGNSTTQLRRPTRRLRRPHSLPLAPSPSLPTSEAHITSQSDSPRHSIISGSSSSSYHSFQEEDKARRARLTQEALPDLSTPYTRVYPTPHESDTQPTAKPQRFQKQPTQTTFDGSILSSAPPVREEQDTSFLSLIGNYLPARTYLYFLLGLPGLYFSRVKTIFEDASLSLTTLERLILDNASTTKMHPGVHIPDDPAFSRLTKSWEEFIDTLIREWKTINLISVLLLSAIVAILQIEKAFLDPIVHYSALFSLVSALISLLFGCMYILRFNTMRRPHKAIQWAQETQRANTNRFWNVWILLAIPAVWLVWSLIFYIVCIMAFVWRVDANSPPSAFRHEFVLAIRIGISVALGVGIIYIIVVLRTFMDFGAPMDDRFKEQVENWIKQKTLSKAPSIRPSTVKDVRPEWSQAYPIRIDPSNVSLRSRNSRYSANVIQPAGYAPSMSADRPIPGRLRDAHVRFRESVLAENIMAPRQKPPFYPEPNLATPDPAGIPRLFQLPSATPPPTIHISSPTSPPTQALPARKRLNPIPPGLPDKPAPPPLQPPPDPGQEASSMSMKTGAQEASLLNTMPLTLFAMAPAPSESMPPVVPTPSQDLLHTAKHAEPSPTPRPRTSVSPLLFNLESEEPYKHFLNHAPFPVKYKGLQYRTVSYLYEAMQYLDEYPEIAEKIRSCEDPFQVQVLSDSFVAQYRHPDWADVFKRKMEDALLLKFRQHSELRELLIGTGRRTIVYSEVSDKFWGDGGDGEGTNELGKALMKVRERLRKLKLSESDSSGSL